METTRRRRRVLTPPPPRAPVVPDGVLALRVAVHEVHAARLPPADRLRLLVHEGFRRQAPRRHRPGALLVRFFEVVDLADRSQRALDLLAQRGRQRRFARSRAFRVALLRAGGAALRGHGAQGCTSPGSRCSPRGWPGCSRGVGKLLEPSREPTSAALRAQGISRGRFAVSSLPRSSKAFAI